MRKCFLHVGTHKTATTSIQHFLDSHPQELARSGYLYPRVGRPEEARAGHHNIAWEISGDRRFRADYGDGEALIREIADTDHNIIISSEDFECSAHHAGKFGKFIVAIQKLGIRMSVIVYLRSQIDYAESLYCTLLQFGFDQPFSLFCEKYWRPVQYSGANGYSRFAMMILSPFSRAWQRGDRRSFLRSSD